MSLTPSNSRTLSAIQETLLDAKGDLIAASAADTAVRLAVGANDKVLRADSGQASGLEYVFPPSYQVVYTEFTASATTAATTEGTATSLASVGSQTYDGTSTYEIEMWAPTWAIDTATRDLLVILHDGTSAIGQLFAGRNLGANLANGDFYVRRIFVPAAGTRTYSIRGYVTGGAATASIIAGAGGAATYLPGFIRLSIVVPT